MKACTTCGETLPAAEFYKDKRRKDGLYSACKLCHQSRTSSWKGRNPHAVRVIRLRTYAKHAEANRAYTREWRKANTERARAAAAAWKLANRARASALEVTRNRRARLAPGDATAEQIVARWTYYGGRCWMCGNDAEHTDHVKPLAKGGSNWPANLRPACAPCNLAKGSIWPFALAA